MRMVEAGDDALFIARRLIVAASEDCSGSPAALQMAVACYQACQVVGYPGASGSMRRVRGRHYLADSKMIGGQSAQRTSRTAWSISPSRQRAHARTAP